VGLDLDQNSREGSARWSRRGPESRRILMIFGLQFADAGGGESFQDLCAYRMVVGWGVVHECVSALEWHVL
jgi:hypothetical protein